MANDTAGERAIRVKGISIGGSGWIALAIFTVMTFSSNGQPSLRQALVQHFSGVAPIPDPEIQP